MSRTYRHNPDDDWDEYPSKKARLASQTRPIGDNRTYRVTSKRRNPIDTDKFVAAMARYVVAQAENDAERNDAKSDLTRQPDKLSGDRQPQSVDSDDTS